MSLSWVSVLILLGFADGLNLGAINGAKLSLSAWWEIKASEFFTSGAPNIYTSDKISWDISALG